MRTTAVTGSRKPGCVHSNAPRSRLVPGAVLNLSIRVPSCSFAVLCCSLVFAWNFSARAASLPAEWQHEQHLDLSAPALVKLSLPPETLDAARPALEDLRLDDDAGNELPYWIEHPAPAGKAVRNAKSFQASLGTATTVITLESGLAQPLDGVTLDTPESTFIKSAQIAGSADGRDWQTLAWGQPVFRQYGGVSQLHLPVPVGVWPWLRVTIDDRRTRPIPFTGARVHAAAAEPVPTEMVPVTIAGRHENPGETRLTLNLGAANLDLAAIQIETAEPLFTRQVTVAVPRIVEDAIREQPLAQGVIYRVAVEGQPPSASLVVPLERSVNSRELLLLVQNQDSPPLAITAVRVVRRPVYLVFLARSAGVYHLLTGNSRCAAPRYDLAALGADLKRVPISPTEVSAVAGNPNYRAPEALPGIQEGGIALDVSAWKYRKVVKVAQSGAQQAELDLDILSHAQPGFGDLRLVRANKQLPYILERTSISRSLAPAITTANDPKDPQVSRWTLKLPRPGLPITRLNCAARTPLFQRDVALYEELADERGEKYRGSLAGAAWVQTPARMSKEFTLALNSAPRGDTMALETSNGDNPPIELERFQAFYPATRVLFKTQTGDELFLYYGNPRVSAPRYDLSLVASQLLAADKREVTLAAEEQLKKSSWAESHTSSKGDVLLWGTLAFVVVVLLAIIARLLPRAQEPR